MTIYTLNRIERNPDNLEKYAENSPLGAMGINSQNANVRYVATELVYLWAEYEICLSQIPIVQKIEDGSITIDDYKDLIVNMRQQVAQGVPWIMRAVSNIEVWSNPELRFISDTLMSHLAEERKDYSMLEDDYVALGGDLHHIQTFPPNIGTVALSSFVFNEASGKNPVHLLGAMLIIEGMGKMKAHGWVSKIREALALEDRHVSFLTYHAVADQSHFLRIGMLLAQNVITEEVARRIVKTAKVIAALYCVQLAHINDN